jgi:hypothetical protein
MRTLIAIPVLAIGLGIVAAAAPQEPAASASSAPTFSKDVAPILYKQCTTCHRPGEIAPMSLLTYQEARPWARAIKEAVSRRAMPPWHAEAPHDTFENERYLSDAERETLVKWADAGAPQGDLTTLLQPPSYPQGWTIGTPDAIFEMTEDYAVPERGVVEYEYFYIPTNFSEPKYVEAIEVRPGNRKLVHHVLVYYKAKPDQTRVRGIQTDRERERTARPTYGLRPRRADDLPSRLLSTYAPGTNPQVLRPGTALKLEAGGIIELQMHYTATGTAGTDRTKVGLIFSKDPAPREVVASQFINARLQLPARASDVKIDADVVFQQDATVWGLFPHTHLRGKRWEYRLELPDGSQRTILSVPRYDFNWQTYYMFREPLEVPKGARLVSSAWYDNSPANRFNPDPSADVTWGDQTWQEMQYTGLLYSLTAPRAVAQR